MGSRCLGKEAEAFVVWYDSQRYVSFILRHHRLIRWDSGLTKVSPSKPANIFLKDSDEEFPHIMLGDFGQAICYGDIGTRHYTKIGDPVWSPPEFPRYRFYSDVWSIGAVMQATCAMYNLQDWTGTQAVVGACRHFSETMHRALISIMLEDGSERCDIETLARAVGHEARR